MVRLIKHSSDWGQQPFILFGTKPKSENQKKICVVCVFKLNNEELYLVLKKRPLYSWETWGSERRKDLPKVLEQNEQQSKHF